jgi:hypothetical protein
VRDRATGTAAEKERERERESEREREGTRSRRADDFFLSPVSLCCLSLSLLQNNAPLFSLPTPSSSSNPPAPPLQAFCVTIGPVFPPETLMYGERPPPPDDACTERLCAEAFRGGGVGAVALRDAVKSVYPLPAPSA